MSDKVVDIKSKSGLAQPKCPFCEYVLVKVNDHYGSIKSGYQLHIISCPSCRKILDMKTLPFL
jgi:hypothetical protein